METDSVKNSERPPGVEYTVDNGQPVQSVTSLNIAHKRRVYTQIEFDAAYKDQTPSIPICERIKSACACSKRKALSTFLAFFPIFNAVRTYKPRQYALGDVLGGLSAAFLHLPQGLGFGFLSSLAPINGLYSTFFPIVLYVIFGTCHHVSFGTNAVIALLTANIVDREADLYVATAGNASSVSEEEILNYKVTVAMAAAFFSGLILFAMGVCRLGFLTMYLSVSFVGGFTTASAVHISTSQVSKMLNIKVKAHSGAGKIVQTYIDIFSNITQTNVADLIIALICVAILLGVKIGINEKFAHKMKMPVPIDLIIVVLGTVISHFALLSQRFGIAIVGDVPNGLPVPSVPRLEAIPRLATEGFVIAIIIFAMTISMAKLMAKQHDYELDDNQELVAYGLSNFLSSFFRCFPSCTAPPRTMILSSLKARTTLNGIPSALFMLVVLLAIGHLFVSLPIAVLAAMIVVAMKNLLLQVRQLPVLWRTSKADFVIWLFTFTVGVLVDLDFGIVVGIGISMLTVVVHTQLSSGSLTELSQEEDMLMPGPRSGSKQMNGIRIFYFNSILYFANAEKFKKEIFNKVLNPNPKKSKTKNNAETNVPTVSNSVDEKKNENFDAFDSSSAIHYIIIDCSAMTFIDMAGVNVLKLVINKYMKIDKVVFLANCPKFALDILHKTGFFDNFPEKYVFFDVWDAVAVAQQRSSLDVTDSTI